MAVTRLLRVSITVADLAGMTAFYRDGLGLEVGPEQKLGDPAWNRLLGLDEGTTARAVDIAVGQKILKLVAIRPARLILRSALRTTSGSSMWRSSPATSPRFGRG